MQIILLHPRLNQAKSLILTRRHMALLAALLCCTVFVLAGLMVYLTVRFSAGVTLPFVREVASMASHDEASKKDRYVKENIAAMATKLGEMQAQMLRLDALGERVQGLAGVKPQEFNFKEPPGRGGAEPSMQSGLSRDITMRE